MGEYVLFVLAVANAVVCCAWAASCIFEYKRKYGVWPWKG